MKRTTVFLDPATERDLQSLAYQRGDSVASLVREALAQYVAKQTAAERVLPRFVAAGASGERDVAERHEELLLAELPAKPAAPAPRQRRRRRS